MSMAHGAFDAADTSVSRGTSSSSLISAGRVQGTNVYNASGEHLGHVEDLMLHKVTGKVAYALMAFGGFLGIGEKYHPLPWSMLKYDVGQEGYVVPLDRKQLEGAPAYERDDFDYDDAEWRDRVHTYYNAPPYWGL
jgi:sporulation protein YlmC with PRC-barrel domain